MFELGKPAPLETTCTFSVLKFVRQQWEKIKKFVLLPTEWTIDNGELTPKLSLKRKVILQKFDSMIKDIYAEQH